MATAAEKERKEKEREDESSPKQNLAADLASTIASYVNFDLQFVGISPRKSPYKNVDIKTKSFRVSQLKVTTWEVTGKSITTMRKDDRFNQIGLCNFINTSSMHVDTENGGKVIDNNVCWFNACFQMLVSIDEVVRQASTWLLNNGCEVCDYMT